MEIIATGNFHQLSGTTAIALRGLSNREEENMLNKFIRATDSSRSSRFHDGDNIFMGWQNFRFIPMVATQWFVTKLFRKYPELPWWPYPAIERIESLIRPDWRVIEFGAGNSTLWMANRVESITSVEDNKQWFDWLHNKIKKDGIRNVLIHLREDIDYCNTSDFPQNHYNLCVVDGKYRYKCVQNILENMIDGGYIYLDNSDQNKDDVLAGDNSCFKTARQILLKHAKETGGSIEYFRGLAPGLFFAQAGMLVRIRR